MKTQPEPRHEDAGLVLDSTHWLPPPPFINELFVAGNKKRLLAKAPPFVGETFDEGRRKLLFDVKPDLSSI